MECSRPWSFVAQGGKLAAEPEWIDRQISGVGRLTTSGDGGMILASCFTHGIQRYDLNGHNEGSYHLGGTAVHAVPDFAGRMIAVATLEGDLAVLNSAGNVRWKQGLSRPALWLEVDPLGRYVLVGHATGELLRLNLYPGEAGSRPRQPGSRSEELKGAPQTEARARSASAALRKPDWSIPAAASEDQAETSVLGVLDTPPRIAVFSSNLRLQLFTTDGRNLGHAPEIQGVGRFLRMAEGWIAGATDRQIVVYNASRNVAQRVDLSLVEVTHLAFRPESFGLAIVQERDRIGRATIAGRWIWKQELSLGIEDLAIGPDATCGLTTESGELWILDAGGQRLGSFQTDPVEPLSLIEAVEGAPAHVAWITLARRAQVLRGHDLRGKVIWESPVSWEGWQFQRLGRYALITAPDGRALAYDGSGHLKAQGRASEGGAKDLFRLNAEGHVRRVTHYGANLICSDLDGRVRWRAVCDEVLGPVAVGQAGVAAFVGRSLSWFAETSETR
ncbi:MAG: hypothetical protein U0794_18015 [Isosphaeraceae bacterium]